MNSKIENIQRNNRIIATIIGVLYIVGTVAGVLSVVFTDPLLNESDMLNNVSENANQVIVGVLLVMIMGVVLAMIPVVLFPIAKTFNQILAVGYVVFRGALETVTYIAAVISSLLLVSLSRGLATSLAPDAIYYNTMGTLLLETNDWISQITTIVFILGAVMFYFLLFRFKLVPRWISGWGLISAIPYLAAGFLVIFGSIIHFSTTDTLLRLPLGLQEIVLAIWLIVKGFNLSESGPGTANQIIAN